MAIFKKLKSISNVQPATIATLSELPIGMTYLGILLKLGGTLTKAHLTRIRAYLSTKLFWELTGTELQKINDYYKFTANSAYLFIPFYTPNARTLEGEMIGAVDTSIQSSMGFEFDIDAASTAPTLEAYALWAPPKASESPYKSIVKAVKRAQHSLASAADHDLKIPLGSTKGSLLKAVHLVHNNSVAKFDVKKEGLDLQFGADTPSLQFVQGVINRTPQTGLVSYDATHSDNQSEVVTTTKLNEKGEIIPASFEFIVTTSGADTITSLSEVYTQIDKV